MKHEPTPSTPAWRERMRQVARWAHEASADSAGREHALQALRVATEDPKWEVRRAAALALADAGDEAPTTRAALERLQADPNRWVREAARASAPKPSPDGWPLTEPDEDPAFRFVASRIRQLGRRSPNPRAILELAEEVGEYYYRQLGADTAHELRTMLTPIVGTVEVLREHLARRQALDPQAGALLDTLDDRAQLLLRLVDDLREYTSESSDPSELLDVDSLLELAWELASGRVGEERTAQVELSREVESGLQLEGSAFRLRLAVANLIANAVQAMPDGGALTLRARSGRQRVVIEVEDQGRGMTEQQVRLAVQRFRTTRRGEGGTGLGLPIARRVVEDLHGGRLSVESAPGEGTCVTIELPLQQEEGSE